MLASDPPLAPPHPMPLPPHRVGRVLLFKPMIYGYMVAYVNIC